MASRTAPTYLAFPHAQLIVHLHTSCPQVVRSQSRAPDSQYERDLSLEVLLTFLAAWCSARPSDKPSPQGPFSTPPWELVCAAGHQHHPWRRAPKLCHHRQLGQPAQQASCGFVGGCGPALLVTEVNSPLQISHTCCWSANHLSATPSRTPGKKRVSQSDMSMPGRSSSLQQFTHGFTLELQ